MPRLAIASEYLGVNQKWLRDGIEKGAVTLVIVGNNGVKEFWPTYYKKGDQAPVLHQRLGGSKYVYMVVDLSDITLDDSPTV